MLKIDLHIHTDPAFYETQFEFSIDKLKEYVFENELQIISITNHNHFNKPQFNEIKNSLPDIIVLPGVEIDIEKSHLLLIGKYEYIDEINNACKKLSNEIKSERDSITFDRFVEIFPDFDKFILIPHYKKSPAMQITTMNKFNGALNNGEVRSAKQFEVLLKQTDKLVPVLFSDVRICEDIEKFPVRNTYVDINEYEFSVLRNALSDRNKVFINDLKKDFEFEFLPDGTTASSKLNVIMGKRSSGKTFNLEKIYASNEENNIKYVKQFSLTGKSEEAKFTELVNKEQSGLIDDYLCPLKKITNKVLEIEEFYDSGIDEYLSTLKEYAENQSLKDAYSKSKLFTEMLYNAVDNLDTREIISAIIKLLETEHNRELVDKYIEKSVLESLLLELLIKREKEYLDYKLKKEVDKIVDFTKRKLSEKSSLKSIQDVDLYEIEKNRIMAVEYNKLCSILIENTLVDTEDVYRFKIELHKSKFNNQSEVKKVFRVSQSLKEAFSYYGRAYEYVKALQGLGIDKNIIHKGIVNFEVLVLNERNAKLSGGERAEYNLLHELKEAEKYDVLLLDEPEASFDNPFIKDYIIDIIKNISNKTTVFLSTHNNTLGVLLKPNKIIYTVASDNVYKVYTGDFGAKYLRTKDDELLITYDNIMDVMEAGKTAYEERKNIYESFKNS